MKIPIELARKHGAEIDYSGIKGSDPANIAYEFDAKELEAYSRALVAPYVEALEICKLTASNLTLTESLSADVDRRIYSIVKSVNKALAAHREMFGGE